MTESVIVALIIGGFGFAGSELANVFSIRGLKNSMRQLEIAISRLGGGVKIGLDNDKVIFKAFRDNCINGESEEQERRMEKYFRDSTINSYGVEK